MVAACDGLDDKACAAVEDVLVERVVGMDPARITTVARKVATRIAADQVAACTAKNKKDRCVQVAPGPDGTTDWWARIPAGRSAAAWAAVRDLGEEYAGKDPALTLDQARADAFIDLLLTNVTVTTKLTLGIPVITGPDGDHARNTAVAEHLAENQTSVATGATGGTETTTEGAGRCRTGRPTAMGRATEPGRPAETPPSPMERSQRARPVQARRGVRPAIATGGCGLGGQFSLSAALISGCEIPGIGFIDADTVEALLTAVPIDIGRALLDARTGTLIETVTTAYRPPKNADRLRDHPRRHLPDVGLRPPRHPLRPRPRQTLARTAPPPRPTSAGSAADTTASSNAAAGPTTWPPTAPPPGPPHQAPSASRRPTTPCSHHHHRWQRTLNPQGHPNENWRR